jgi:DNA polymerase-3 subunit delta'
MDQVTRIPGAKDALEQLERALASSKLAPTWLFHGPENTGKWALAHRFAQALLCPQCNPWGCGECPSCRRATTFTHGDLFLLFGYPTGGGSGKARDRFHEEFTANFLDYKRVGPLLPYPEARNRFMPAERISDLINWAYLKPGLGSRKVAIVYEAELIVRTVVDKLLKLTEEPPADTIIILVSHKPEQLPATIRSRSRPVRFKRSGPRGLTQYLLDSGVEKTRATTIARRSQGCVGVALSMVANEEADDPQAEALKLLGRLVEPDGGTLMELQVFQWQSERSKVNDYLDTWATFVRDVALVQKSESLLDAPAKLRQQFAGLADPDLAAAALVLIRESQAALATNTHIGTTLVALAGRLARLGAQKPLGPRIWPVPQRV